MTAAPISFYEELTGDAAFRDPIPWGEVAPAEFDGLLLAGGYVSARWPGDSYLFARRFESLLGRSETV